MFKTLLISSVPDGATLPLVPAQNNFKPTLSKVQKVPKPSTYKTECVLIPENLELLLLLSKNPPDVKQCNNDIHIQGEKCAVIVSLIMSAYMRSENAQRISYKGFANVSAQILQKYVQDYTEYIDFLINVGVIETDNHYIKGEKSIGYRLTPEYIDAPLKECVISNHHGNSKLGAAVYNKVFIPTPEQKITMLKHPELYQDLLSVTVDDIDQAKEYIYKGLYDTSLSSVLENIRSKRNGTLTHYNKLKDDDKHNFIHPLIIRKQNDWYRSLYDLKHSRVYFKRDNTSFRLHTSLLSLKSECRHFLKLQGGNIISCDLKNSQPYISSFFFTPGVLNQNLLKILIKCFSGIKNKDEDLYKDIIKRIRYYKKGNILPSTRKYINLVQSGEIYEYISTNISIYHTIKRNKPIRYNRTQGKNCVFKLFFNPTKYDTLVRDFFRIQFPQVAALFEDINRLFTHTKKESEYRSISRSKNILAVTLQTIESYLILDVICKKIKDTYPHIPLLTLHDAIASNPEYKDLLLEELKSTFTSYIGIPPSIKVEDWSIPALD